MAADPAACEPSGRTVKPRLPDQFFHLPTKARLKAARQYLKSFEYKQTPETHFNSHKLRPLSRIMDTARMIVYSPQPIKCVEAVFLALYLTAGLTDVDRIPLSFKTECEGQVHQHIVLVLRHGGKYGALGISRRPDLMDKDLTFDSMSSLIRNYIEAYAQSSHSVLKVRVGLPVEHDLLSRNHVCWRSICINVAWMSWEECCEALVKHELQAKRLWDKWLLEGKGGDPKRIIKAKKAPLDTNAQMLKRKTTVPDFLDTALRLACSEHSPRLRLQSPALEPFQDNTAENSDGDMNVVDSDQPQVTFTEIRSAPTLTTFRFGVKSRRIISSGCRMPLIMAAKPIKFHFRKPPCSMGLLEGRPIRRVRQFGYRVPYLG